MKTKTIKIKHKKELKEINYVEFEDLLEAINLTSEQDVFKIYQYGLIESTKLMAKGINVFKPKVKTLKIRTDQIPHDLAQKLLELIEESKQSD